MAFIESVVAFIASLVLGTIGIYLGAKLVIGESSYENAALTALIGVLALAIVGFFLGGIPLLGPLLMLVAWVWVINSRYSGSWMNAILIGFLAWIIVLGILYILAVFGITGFEAIGIPGA